MVLQQLIKRLCIFVYKYISIPLKKVLNPIRIQFDFYTKWFILKVKSGKYEIVDTRKIFVKKCGGLVLTLNINNVTILPVFS